MSRRLSLRAASLAVVALSGVALVACGRKEGSGNAPAVPPATDAAAGSPAASGTPGPSSAATPADAAPIPDHVVVEVNGQPIRAKKILGEIEANKMRARAMGRPMGPDEEAALHGAALDAFVADELLFQAAKAEGIVPGPAEVDAEIKTVQSGFPSAEKYQEFLRAAGVTDAEVRDEATHRVTVRNYVKKLAGNTAVPETEARTFYDANKEQFGVPEQVHAAIIVVTSKPGDAEPLKADARRRAEEARKKAAAGEDFAALAKQYSQIPNAAKGGDLGFFGRGENLFPKIEETAFATPPGQVSPVFETPTGFNVIKVLEKHSAGTRSFDEVKGMLIVELGRRKEGAAIEAKLGELHKTAKIELKDPSFLAQPPAAPGPGAAPAPPPPQGK